MPRPAHPDAVPAVFAPAALGPLTLRNRIIKAATFEGVMPGGKVSDALVEFHRRVAAGGAALSTVAYLAVSPEGRTDRHCLLLDEDTVPGLRRLTDAVHAEGAAAAAQIGHAGPVANARSNGAPALSPSGGFTPMGSRLRAVDAAGIERITEDYRRATPLAVEAGFDSIEVHVGHNYLLSAFLSPKLNRRDDQFGGSVENRARFARDGPAHRARRRPRRGGGDRQAQHGRRRGRGPVARRERRGRPALRGRRRARCARAHRGQLAGQSDVPLPGRRAARRNSGPPCRDRSGWASASSATASCSSYPYEEAFFLPYARQFRAALSTPLILLGGITELATIETALAEGFAFVAMARALLREPDLPNRMQADAATTSLCIHCNKCMPTIYSGTRCVLVTDPPGSRPPGSAYAATGGRRPAHGAASSSWPASESSVSSSPKRPTNCTPMGSPASFQCSGSEIPGCPVTLNGGVKGT